MNLTFIIGTGRCGSTLLHEIVAKHPDVSYFTNFEDRHGKIGFLGRYLNSLYKKDYFALDVLGKQNFAPSEAYRLIAKEVSPIYVRPYRDLTAEDLTPWLDDKFSEYFKRAYIKNNKPVFVHKYTGWSRIGFFSSIFPEAKFIHIIRDGRAVANSWLQMKWWGGYEGPENWLWGSLSSEHHQEWKDSKYSFPTLAGISWKVLMKSYELSSASLNKDNYLIVKYEDFLNDPEGIMKEILLFSNLEWKPEFIKEFNKFNIRTSRSKAFEKDLNHAQLHDLEKCIAGVLKDYDYI